MGFHSGFGFHRVSTSFEFAPDPFTPGGNGPGPTPFTPPSFGPVGEQSNVNRILAAINEFGCEAVRRLPGICATTVTRDALESLCPNACGGMPTLEDIDDPRGFVDDLGPQPIPQGNGVVGACPTLKPKAECTVTRNTKCGPVQVAGRLKVDCATGQAVCVPKPRRMNPMNAAANRRSMTRLKGAHREAKKIIDTLDTFAKPRRSRAPSRAAKCAC